MDGIRCDRAEVSSPPSDMDAIIKYLSDKQFLELKTSRHIEFPKQETSFRLDLPSWFLKIFKTYYHKYT